MLSPETQVEQIMGYVVGAAELIPTLKLHAGESYSVALLPQGPHFYTGLLEAAGYLLLDSKKKKVMILTQQSEDPKNVLVYGIADEATFGKTWKKDKNIMKSCMSAFGAQTIENKKSEFIEKIDTQLSFIRVINETQSFVSLGIGDEISKLKSSKLLSRIAKQIHEYLVIIVENTELPKGGKNKSTDEHKEILQTIQKPTSSQPLLALFQKILVLQKKDPEIVAYVNPKDFRKT